MDFHCGASYNIERLYIVPIDMGKRENAMDDRRASGREDLPIDVGELGELRSAELECPGVYFVIVETEIELNGIPVLEGYYVVLDGAPISREARAYGTPLRNGQGIAFRLNQEGGGRVDLPALMNAILEYRPEYAVSHNLYEQSGLNDAMAMLLRAMGVEAELKSSEERMIALTPGAGTDYLRW